MYRAVETTRFRKSLKKVSQYRNFDRRELERVVDLLCAGRQLEIHHQDHELKGKYAGIRECHIKNDLLLMYQKKQNIFVLLLVDIGTHPYLFGK